MATKTTTVRARIEPAVKREAEETLHELGLSASEAINLFYRQIIYNRGLPFEVKLPNRETLETFAKTDAGEDVHRAKDADDLFDQLGI
jgi:DNA-damage-inducible protein J